MNLKTKRSLIKHVNLYAFITCTALLVVFAISFMSQSKVVKSEAKQVEVINTAHLVVLNNSSEEITTVTEDKTAFFKSDELIPEPPAKTVKTSNLDPKETLLGKYTITAYCSCEICCGKWAKNRPNGVVYGSSGIALKPNHSVASPLPSGTRIRLEGLGEYKVEDKTADWIVEKYEGKIVDIYFNNHKEAKEFGKRELNVYKLRED